MPLCVRCGKPLNCTCTASAAVGNSAQPCPLKKGAIWVHVVNDKGEDVKGVTVKKGGDSKITDASGIAQFDPLDPNTYSMDLDPLSDDLKKDYQPPSDPTKEDVTVSNGEITYLAYKLRTKPQMKVKVAAKDGAKVFGGATVSITGPQSAPDKKSLADTGFADFGKLEAGKYTIKVVLSEEDAKNYATTVDFSKTTVEKTLESFDDITVTVDVEPINIVTPKLELEYKVVLLEPKLFEKQKDTEKKIYVGATYVQLSYTQTNKEHPYPKGGKFECTPANVTVYLDEKCKTEMTADLTEKQLTGDTPLKLYLRGKTAGKFKAKLTLTDPADRFIRLEKNPTDEQEMGVVKLELKIHQQDESKLTATAMQVDPDTDPVDTYYTNLQALVLPDQKLMADADKVGAPSTDDAVKPGRLLHVQDSGNFGRAKLICTKIDPANLPAGTDDYVAVLKTGLGYALKADKDEDFPTGDADKPAAGSLDIYDKEFEGTKQDALKIKFSTLKAADQTYFVEGTAESDAVCGVRLDLGMDRDTGGLDKTVKRNGDWGRFTVIKIKEVKLDYTAVSGTPNAWNESEKKFYINFKTNPAGRKINIKATLTKKFKNVKIYLMLAPDKDNLKTANWGIDIPSTWKWKDITKDVKHLDKADRKNLLHLSDNTDADGNMKKELQLSRFGGDKFLPAAYILEDAHLAKFVDGHAELKKKKPVACTYSIQVWRKFWYQLIEVTGVTNPGVAGAAGQYTRIKADMAAATPKTMTAPAGSLYKRYMIQVNGGNANALVVTDVNKNTFFSGIANEAEKPIKIPILVCDAQWDTGPNTSAVTTGWLAVGGYDVTMDRLIINPPLQGGSLLVSGTIAYMGKLPDSSWDTQKNAALTNAEISVSPGRDSLYKVTVRMPAAVTTYATTHPNTNITIMNLVVQGAKGPYLGESFSKKVLAVYESDTALKIADFQNTIAHEIGHGFGQTVRADKVPTGVIAHPNQYLSYDSDGVCTGSHCNKDTDKCVMYQSGPIAGSLNRFCDVCHPYMLLGDMSVYT